MRALLLGDAGPRIATGLNVAEGARPGYLYSYENSPDGFERALADAEARAKDFFSSPDVLDRLWEIFPGKEGAPSLVWQIRARQLVSAVLEERFSTEVRFLGFRELNGAMAGFVTRGERGRPLILVNSDWLAAGISHHGMVRLALEELGHSFDWGINGHVDSPGDEGELFAVMVLGEEADEEALERIRREDDSNQVRLGDTLYGVEEAAISFVATFLATGSKTSGAALTGTLRFVSDPDNATFLNSLSSNKISGTLAYSDPTTGDPVSASGTFTMRSPTGNPLVEALYFELDTPLTGTVSGTDCSAGCHLWTVLSNAAAYGPNATAINSSANAGDAIAEDLDEYVVETAPDADASTVAASESSVPADNSTTSTITVTVKTDDGTALADATIVLGQGAASSTISPAEATTDVSGVALFTVKSSVAETVTYTATASANGTETIIPETVDVTFTAVDGIPPAVSGVTLGDDGSGNLALGFQSDEQLATIAVSVDGPSDGSGWPVAFDANDFTESGGDPYSYTLATTQAYSDGDGVYSAAVDDATDAAGNDGADGTDTDTHTFDGTPPTFLGASSTPVDGATDVAVGSNLVLAFSEPVAAGAGSIELAATGGSTVEAFDVATGAGDDGGTVSFNGDEITLNPTSDLSGETAYHVTVASTAIEDAAGNSFAGISNSTDYNFTTADSGAPTITGGTLASDNGYVDVASSEGVYTNSGGSGALTAGDFGLTFSRNGGAAMGASITGVTTTAGGSLTGGESTVRVAFSLTNGPASGVETVAIEPADGASIYDAAGNAMASSETTSALTLNDGLGPTLSAAAVDGTTLTLTYNESLNTVAPASSAYTVTGTTTTPAVSAVSISGSVVTLTLGTAIVNGETVTIDYTVPGSNAVQDAAGNEASALSGEAVANNTASVDDTAPTVDIQGEPSIVNSTAAFNVTFEFSESVTGFETGDITIGNGSASGFVAVDGNSYTADITPSGAGDITMAVAAGVAQDGAGNDNTAATRAVTTYDATAPTFNGAASSPADAATGVALGANVVLAFSETVVAGTGVIELRATSDNTLVESFDVATGAGDRGGTLGFSGDKVTLNPTSDLSGQTAYHVTVASTAIEDAAGNSFAGISKSSDYSFITADVGAPTISNVTSTKADGSYTIGEVIDVTVEFDEAVTVTGTPLLLLEIATEDRSASYQTGSGGTTLTFRYTVQSGDASSDLDYESTAALSLNGGTIEDGSNNHATLTLPAVGGAGSLSDNKALVIDTEAPTFDGASSSPADDATGVAVASDLVLAFSEAVVAGTGMIELRATSHDTLVESFDVVDDAGTGTGQVSFSGEQVTLNLTSELSGQTSYHVLITSTAVEDPAGNGLPSMSAGTDYNFTTGDVAAPQITGPSGSVDVATSSVTVAENTTAVFTFTANEPVTWTLTGGDDADAFTIDSSTGGLTFTQAPDYEAPADANEDNAYVVAVTATDGSSNTSSQTVTVTVSDIDEVAPTFDGPSSSPADDATGVAVGSRIVMAFSETVVAATGVIELRATTGDTLIESFDVVDDAGTDPGQVSFSGDEVTLTPTGDLTGQTAYHVTIASTALGDTAGNSFAGISDTTDYDFTTAAGAPDAVASTLTPTSATITANGSSTQVLTVTAKDASGHDVGAGGATVLITRSSGTGSIGSVSDNGDGTYTATVTSPTSTGSGVFVATLGDDPVEGGTEAQVEAVVEFTVGGADADASDVVADPTTITADGTSTSTITVTVRDSKGNIRTAGGDDVFLATDTGDLSEITDNGDGTYTATLSSSTAAGTATVTVYLGTDVDGEELGTATIQFESSLEAVRLVVTTSPPDSVEAGQPLGPVTVEARDEEGNLVPSWAGDVTLRITDGTGDPTAELFGTTRVATVDGIASFSDPSMERAGVGYTLTASHPDLEAGVSTAFKVSPGPPWSIKIVEVSEEEAVEASSAQGYDVAFHSHGSDDGSDDLDGNRIPLRMTIYDEFDNETFVKEGATPVRLSTSSATGAFFSGQTDVEPITTIVIPVSVPSVIFFYEDPTVGNPQISGVPDPPSDAPQINSGATSVRISQPESVHVSPTSRTGRVTVRYPFVVSLQDSDGERVRAPDPGVSVALASSSGSGRFFLAESGGEPVASATILPAVSAITLYYEDSAPGSHSLTFTGTGLPQSTAGARLELSGHPGPPTDVRATPGDGQVTVTWEAPAATGGAAITDYVLEYSLDGGVTWTAVRRSASTATTATVHDLTNGSEYIFRAAAINSEGKGDYSEPSSGVKPAVAEVELELAVEVDDPTPSVGDSITISVILRNDGSRAAEDVVVYGEDLLGIVHGVESMTLGAGDASDSPGQRLRQLDVSVDTGEVTTELDRWLVGGIAASSAATMTIRMLVVEPEEQ